MDTMSRVIKKLYTLPNESCDVEFKDVFNDPLEIAVTIRWRKKLGYKSIKLYTKITK